MSVPRQNFRETKGTQASSWPRWIRAGGCTSTTIQKVVLVAACGCPEQKSVRLIETAERRETISVKSDGSLEG